MTVDFSFGAPPVQAAIIMGVSGCGKSAVGTRVAATLRWAFVDADDLHPAANIDKMATGTPLTDEDREGWLDTVDLALRTTIIPTVMACSALKRQYRDRLRALNPNLTFIHLTGSHSLLSQRLGGRTGHFMPASLLDSQLRALEPLAEDEAGLTLSAAAPLTTIVGAAAHHLRAPDPGSAATGQSSSDTGGRANS